MAALCGQMTAAGVTCRRPNTGKGCGVNHATALSGVGLAARYEGLAKQKAYTGCFGNAVTEEQIANPTTRRALVDEFLKNQRIRGRIFTEIPDAEKIFPWTKGDRQTIGVFMYEGVECQLYRGGGPDDRAWIGPVPDAAVHRVARHLRENRATAKWSEEEVMATGQAFLDAGIPAKEAITLTEIGVISWKQGKILAASGIPLGHFKWKVSAETPGDGGYLKEKDTYVDWMTRLGQRRKWDNEKAARHVRDAWYRALEYKRVALNNNTPGYSQEYLDRAIESHLKTVETISVRTKFLQQAGRWIPRD